MKKIIVPFLLLLLATSLQAQVNFSLSLLPDQETYLVSLVSDKDIPAPMNMASNVQIVLKIPSGEPFLAGEIESQVPGVEWVDNAFAKQSESGTEYGLCAFVMTQSVTKAISFEAGVETPLFTFKNLESGCVGALSLPENQDAEVYQALGRGFNFTQNITLLATRGNAYSGVINKVADCNALSTSVQEELLAKDLKAYPVPAKDQLTIEWFNPNNFESLELDVLGANGQLLQNIAVDPKTGAHKIELAIENYPTGLYNFILKNDKGDYQQYKFIKVD